MKILIFFVLFSTILINSLSAQQINQFQVDTVSNTIAEAFPFDRPFIIKVRGNDASSVASAFIFTWKQKGNGNRKFVKEKVKPKDICERIKNVFKRKNRQLKKTDILKNDVFPVKGGVNLYVNSLPPNKNFAILLAHRFDGELLKDIMKANGLLSTKNNIKAKKDSIDNEAIKILNKVPDKVREQVDRIVGFNESQREEIQKVSVFKSSNFDTRYKQFYKQSLDTSYQRIDTSLIILNPVLLTVNNLNISFDLFNRFKIDSTELVLLSKPIIRNDLVALYKGNNSLDAKRIYAYDFDIERRIDNLSGSIEILKKLSGNFEILGMRTKDTTILDMKSDMDVSIKTLTKNKEILNKDLNIIKDRVTKNKELFYQTWAAGNNEFTDLKTKGGYLVIPDIGVATIFAKGNYQNETIVRPYFGASIYFRAVDKSIPFRNYTSNRFVHKISLNLGVTLGKINKGEFSDLFNSLSFLAGGNYKITREFALSAGVAFMQRKDYNMGIESLRFNCNPYVGLSFDMDFTNSIQKLTGKIFQ